MADTDTKTLEAKCYCGAVHFTLDVPLSAIPLKVHLCHCSICRFGTGAPSVFHTALPKGVLPNFIAPSSKDNMTSWTNQGQLTGSMNFCSTCGCHITAIGIESGRWVISPSIVVNYGPDIFGWNLHVFSKSAKDLGIAPMLTQIGDHKMPDWNPPDDDPRAKIFESEPETGEDGRDRLRAQCHCGGVSFTIQRPTQRVRDDEFMGSFVSPINKEKWLASLDVCGDCRVLNGTHVAAWAFVPLSFCEPTIKPDLKIGTAKTYRSSPDVLRSFCGTCGATVFYSVDDRRPSDDRQIVNLSVGILRAPEGFMAENWLTWRPRLGGEEGGVKFDKDFTQSLKEGMASWALQKNGEVLNVETG